MGRCYGAASCFVVGVVSPRRSFSTINVFSLLSFVVKGPVGGRRSGRKRLKKVLKRLIPGNPGATGDGCSEAAIQPPRTSDTVPARFANSHRTSRSSIGTASAVRAYELLESSETSLFLASTAPAGPPRELSLVEESERKSRASTASTQPPACVPSHSIAFEIHRREAATHAPSRTASTVAPPTNCSGVRRARPPHT